MKTLVCLLAALAVSVSALAETSPVYFRGILKLGNAQHFSVATEGGAKTAWVAIGDSFHGYEVTAFDAEQNLLVLHDEDGKEMRLGLAGGTVAEAKAGRGAFAEHEVRGDDGKVDRAAKGHDGKNVPPNGRAGRRSGQ